MKISYKTVGTAHQRHLKSNFAQKEVGIAAGTMSKLNKGEEVALLFCYASAITLIAILGTSAKLYARKNSQQSRRSTIEMERKEYSAGAVKLSFWFIEFRKSGGASS